MLPRRASRPAAALNSEKAREQVTVLPPNSQRFPPENSPQSHSTTRDTYGHESPAVYVEPLRQEDVGGLSNRIIPPLVAARVAAADAAHGYLVEPGNQLVDSGRSDDLHALSDVHPQVLGAAGGLAEDDGDDGVDGRAKPSAVRQNAKTGLSQLEGHAFSQSAAFVDGGDQVELYKPNADQRRVLGGSVLRFDSGRREYQQREGGMPHSHQDSSIEGSLNETASEHVRNALALMQSGGLAHVETVAAIEARLYKALASLERQPGDVRDRTPATELPVDFVRPMGVLEARP